MCLYCVEAGDNDSSPAEKEHWLHCKSLTVDHWEHCRLLSVISGSGDGGRQRLLFSLLLLQVVNVTGNQDICYYNFLCAHPLGVLR